MKNRQSLPRNGKTFRTRKATWLMLALAGWISCGASAEDGPAPVKFGQRGGILPDVADYNDGIWKRCPSVGACPEVRIIHVLPDQFVPVMDRMTGQYEMEIRPVMNPRGVGLSQISFDFRVQTQLSAVKASELLTRYPNAIALFPSASASELRVLETSGIDYMTAGSRNARGQRIDLQHFEHPELIRVRIDGAYIRHSACLVQFYRQLKDETQRVSRATGKDVSGEDFSANDDLTILGLGLNQQYAVEVPRPAGAVTRAAEPSVAMHETFDWSLSLSFGEADLARQRMSDKIFDTLMRYGSGGCSCREILTSQSAGILGAQLKRIGKTCRELITPTYL